MSEVIIEELGIDVSVLSGANIANEVALEKFCETTIGSKSSATGLMFKQMFHTPYFQVNVVDDVAGVELCGALKNIVALAAGLIDGLKLGENAKAAIIRIGLVEMKRFCIMFYQGIHSDTFFESCGIADLITTCNGGRHRQVAEAKVLTGKVIFIL
jgi:glycerol-3-phosphate dehydrogenase (NAD+)